MNQKKSSLKHFRVLHYSIAEVLNKADYIAKNAIFEDFKGVRSPTFCKRFLCNVNRTSVYIKVDQLTEGKYAEIFAKKEIFII